MIEVSQLHKSFGQQQVLCGVNLKIDRGESVVIIGGSGCGKSVLLRHIIGLVQPDEGDVKIDGQSIADLSERELIKVRRKFGMLFQGAALFDSLTVEENVGFLLDREQTMSPEAIRETVADALELVDLGGTQGKKPAELSGGMKRRVLIAKALSHEPRVLFLDEPTAGVDVELRKDMWNIVAELKASGVTIILTTHYIEEAEAIADRVGVINDGALLLVEEKENLMARMGQKQLEVQLTAPVAVMPEALAHHDLQLVNGGDALIYTYDTRGERTGITALLNDVAQAGLVLADVQTRQSSLEDIFVDLVSGDAP